MKKISCLLLLFVCVKLYAQIPNPSFENWYIGKAIDWTTYNIFHSPVSVAHEGTLAIRSDIAITSTSIPNVYTNVPFQTGTGVFMNPYIPISGKPTKLLGWFIFNGSGDDTMRVNVNVKSLGNIIGQGEFLNSITTPNYAQFVLNISYSSLAVPDSFMISFGFKTNIHLGSHFFIDDLSFDSNVGVQENKINPSFITVFPNPAKTSITFFNSIIQTNRITKMEVYSASGEYLVTKAFEPYEITELDVSSLNSGLYLVRIWFENGTCITKKITKE